MFKLVIESSISYGLLIIMIAINRNKIPSILSHIFYFSSQEKKFQNNVFTFSAPPFIFQAPVSSASYQFLLIGRYFFIILSVEPWPERLKIWGVVRYIEKRPTYAHIFISLSSARNRKGNIKKKLRSCLFSTDPGALVGFMCRILKEMENLWRSLAGPLPRRNNERNMIYHSEINKSRLPRA